MFMHHIFFIHSFFDQHFGCFHILVIVNNVSEHRGLVGLLEILFSLLEVGLLDHMMALFFNFLKTLLIIFHSGYTNLHSKHQHTSVPFLSI